MKRLSLSQQWYDEDRGVYGEHDKEGTLGYWIHIILHYASYLSKDDVLKIARACKNTPHTNVRHEVSRHHGTLDKCDCSPCLKAKCKS